jgi:hypothetical protein
LLSIVVVLLLLLLREATQAVALVAAHVLSRRELAPAGIFAFGFALTLGAGFFALSSGSFFLSVALGLLPARIK